MTPSELTTLETGTYFSRYTSLVPELSILDGLKYSSQKLMQTLGTIPEEKWNFAYEKDKWSIKELLLHIIDTERIFIGRAVRFVRKDITSLPGYDENEYASVSMANERTSESLIEEFNTVRAATESFFSNLTEEQLLYMGTASGGQISVRAIGYLLAGHGLHHLTVINERYL